MELEERLRDLEETRCRTAGSAASQIAEHTEQKRWANDQMELKEEKWIAPAPRGGWRTVLHPKPTALVSLRMSRQLPPE